MGLQFVRLVPDHLVQQEEKVPNLVVGASPVLAAEGVKREDFDSAPDAVADDLADRLDTGGVAFHLDAATRLRPAPIAIHDDGDVAGQFRLRNDEWLRRRGVRRHRASPIGRQIRLPVDERRGVRRARNPTGH